MAVATLLTPASLSIAIYEFHPEALAAPLILLLIEARLAGRRGAYWLWFLAVLAIKENMAPLLIRILRSVGRAGSEARQGMAGILEFRPDPCRRRLAGHLRESHRPIA